MGGTRALSCFWVRGGGGGGGGGEYLWIPEYCMGSMLILVLFRDGQSTLWTSMPFYMPFYSITGHPLGTNGVEGNTVWVEGNTDRVEGAEGHRCG